MKSLTNGQLIWVLPVLTVGDEEEVDLTEYKSSVEASLGVLKPDSIALKRVRRLPDRMPRGKLRDELEIINEICHEELSGLA